jgi:cell division protein FtsL
MVPYNNSIQFNSSLFTCKLKSPETNYKVSTGRRKKQKTYKLQNKAFYIIIMIIIIIIITIIVVVGAGVAQSV